MIEKDWELLLQLYEEGTITKTAQKLYISQPALTYRIKQIEKEFNTKIIYRGSKGVHFTNEGEYLVQYARKMLKELHKTKDNIENLKEDVQGTLRLGISSNFALYQLPVLLEGFISKYPNVEINLTTGWSSNVLQLLQGEDVQIAILRGEHNWSDAQLTLNREPISIASKEEIDLSELPNLNLIRYQTDAGLKQTFDGWWQHTFNVRPRVSMEVDRIETCKELVKKGLGYGIFPSISLKDEDQLHTFDLTYNNQKVLRKTSMLYRKEFLDLNVVSAFVNFIRDFYHIRE
ncbi:LysR family transcriptional regulator [Salirhabdus salicampi]|uniref:LysR family transcriptional regulator n=1 Tax=Salirhabdus salicampi TaxID=476102 RepID=UPI0020C3490B|nr:LysR family transcriptional regulator [Salirhabdus salicampi]MCP8615921.1 LysR family transcriptional regulator [Salirhabdus salicampi]